MPALIDITGQRYGRLVVLERDKETQIQKQSKEVFWKCQCDCGTIFSARGHDIKQNKILSCGCLKKENARNINFSDIKGQKFGKLTVLFEIEENTRVDRHTYWQCKCDCGNECVVSGKQLRTGKTKSCGCLKSSGELKIIQILYENNIPFETQKTFEGCKNKLLLKFDFYLPTYNTVIEYNGEQHYMAVDFLGGEERFKQQQIADNIKKDWCFVNNVNYIEIPYTDYDQINFEYLKERLENFSL